MTYTTRGEESTRGSENEQQEDSLLPMEFLEWQRESRIALMRLIQGSGERVRSMPSHLPVLASLSEDGSINLATKGIGLIPKPGLLAETTREFRQVAQSLRDRPPGDTATERMAALLKFYDGVDNFDPSILGGLEIFEGVTHTNLVRDPRLSLLFTGEAPDFRSYQIDGVVRFVRQGDPYYEFLHAARELFARDRFHVVQDSYPHGYIVHVTSVRTKTPFSRRP